MPPIPGSPTPLPDARPGPAVPTPRPAVETTSAGPTHPAPGTRAEARLTDVVPAPERVEPAPEQDFVLPEDAVVRVDGGAGARDVADHLADLLRPATGYPLPVTETATAASPGEIALTLDADAADGLGPQGYRLQVATDGVRLTAGTATGLFHGVQTLRQLLPAAIESPTPVTAAWVLPGGTIVDRPRFAYRGAMLDVARHFFAVPDVLRVLDHLARYKINHLHLHLTDDQGWRIAVDTWPRLATVGGAGAVGGGPGGYYTRDDYRLILDHAARRHVTVVPEIDLPGHTNAALTAYPQLAPDRVAPPPYTGTEVGFSYVDPTSEQTYAFVTDVLREVAAASPGPYLHIGGDEAFKVPADAYAHFVERVQRIVSDLGKTVIGWHQIAPTDHVDRRIVQWWGTDGNDPTTAEAVRRGARLVLSPADRAYLDMKYDPDTPIGHDWAGLIDLHRAYDWDPGTHLTGVPESAVLGVEAPLWTESVTTRTEIEFMLFPRLPAIAELAWSPRATHDWSGFRHRLATHLPRWDRAGITYHRGTELPGSTAATVPTPRTDAQEPVPTPRTDIQEEVTHSGANTDQTSMS
ncbi:beta-N-acetylhexosaminidase [Micromonospora sp. SH-82]